MIKRKGFIFFLILLFTLFSKEAHAYVDPAVIGYLYQLGFILFSIIVVFLAVLRNRVSSAICAAGRFIKSLFIQRKDEP